jgi:hypothetical protein
MRTYFSVRVALKMSTICLFAGMLVGVYIGVRLV